MGSLQATIVAAMMVGTIVPALSGSVLADNTIPFGQFDKAQANMNSADVANFNYGRGFFHHTYVENIHADGTTSGLGPTYNARSCVACHIADGRGLGFDENGAAATGVVVKFVGSDTPHPDYGAQIGDQSVLGLQPDASISAQWETLVAELNDGTMVTLQRPELTAREWRNGQPAAKYALAARIASPLIGMGIISDLPDTRFLALADPMDKDGDGISGRISWVKSDEGDQLVIGRFGWKAEAPSLIVQTARAAHNDMGLDSVVAGISDPKQAEIDRNLLELIAFYVSRLALPDRPAHTLLTSQGAMVFSSIGCAACHTTTIQSAPDQRVQPFSDFLLHDLGQGLADPAHSQFAEASEWRTAPLWGLSSRGYAGSGTKLLHDGRAATVIEAILWHGGEAEKSRNTFAALAQTERQALIAFVDGL